MFAELEVVELARDLPEAGLAAGTVGTVVMIYGEGEAYEVEFFDDADTTIGVETVWAADLRKRPPRTVRELNHALQKTTRSSQGSTINQAAGQGSRTSRRPTAR